MFRIPVPNFGFVFYKVPFLFPFSFSFCCRDRSVTNTLTKTIRLVKEISPAFTQSQQMPWNAFAILWRGRTTEFQNSSLLYFPHPLQPTSFYVVYSTLLFVACTYLSFFFLEFRWNPITLHTIGMCPSILLLSCRLLTSIYSGAEISFFLLLFFILPSRPFLHSYVFLTFTLLKCGLAISRWNPFGVYSIKRDTELIM